MKSNNKNEIVYYKDVLSKLDIITIGLCIVKYEQKLITYKELKETLKQKNIELKPYLHDFSKRMMSIQQYEELKTKFKNEEYEPEHLNAYIISSEHYNNVLIRYDRPMINVLAEYGEEYSKKVLERLIEWEKNFLAKTK